MVCPPSTNRSSRPSTHCPRFYYSHVTDEGTEVPRDQSTCPRASPWMRGGATNWGLQVGVGNVRPSPSSSKLLKAPHQRVLLFCLLEAQPQEAQVNLQGAIGVEAEAVQRDVCSLLPLPDTKEAQAAQPSSHQPSPTAPARDRNRVAPAPPAAVPSPGRESLGHLEVSALGRGGGGAPRPLPHHESKVIHLGVRSPDRS